MWKYLKYFVPLVLFAVAGFAAYLIGTENKEANSSWVLPASILPLILSAFWYLYYTKNGYKYAIPIGISVVFAVVPFLLRAMNFIDMTIWSEYFWGKRIWLWHFTLGATFVSGFYVLRFYKKPKQDAFSSIKLLIVLLASILFLVNMVFVEDDKIIMYSFFTNVGLMIILCAVHIVDMILWEKANEKSRDDLHSLDNLIEEISGK